MFDSIEQTSLRLKNTYVLYNDDLYKVSQALDKDTVEIIRQDGKRVVSLNDVNLNYYDYRLGYASGTYGGTIEAYYLVRSPHRQQRQGLIMDAIVGICALGGNGELIERGAGQFLRTSELEKCLKGQYATFDEALKTLEEHEHVGSVPFSRRLAVRLDRDLGFYTLQFKGRRIAWGDPHNFNMPSEFLYLREVIEKSGVKIR